MLAAIAIVDSHGGIAKDGKQPMFIKEDLKRFHEITKSHAVVYGRKTYEQMGLLKDRENYILSRSLIRGSIARVEVFQEALEKDTEVHIYPDYQILVQDLYAKDEVAFVIGGSEIYELLLPYCNLVYLTRVNKNFHCDRFFPTMDIFDWIKVEDTGPIFLPDSSEFIFSFETYARNTD